MAATLTYLTQRALSAYEYMEADFKAKVMGYVRLIWYNGGYLKGVFPRAETPGT